MLLQLKTCFALISLPLFISPHWLLIKFRIQFKISLLVHEVRNSQAPPYISELLTPYTFSRSKIF